MHATAEQELPTHYRLSVRRGGPISGYIDPLAVPFDAPAVVSPAASRGPRWFREMDRNRDGDLAPREFLGTHEQFQELDKDADGLIDADEATALAE